MAHRWCRVAWGIVAATALFSVVSCGRDGEEREGTQPAPDVTSFEQGRFDNLPVFPRSDPFGPRSEKEGIVSRSYRATGVTADEIIDFYAEELAADGWEMTEPVFRSDTETRGDWVVDDYRLEVSAARIDDDRNPTSENVVIQYGLVLRPR